MTSFRGLVLILLVLLVLLSGSMSLAQGMIVTNTPQPASADDAGEVPDQVVEIEPEVAIDDSFISTIVAQVLLFATVAVVVVGVVLLVIFVFFIRSVVPALKASISEEWQPVIFPILDGVQNTLSGAAINLAKRLEEKAKETETTIDDELIERILRSLDPPDTASADNRF